MEGGIAEEAAGSDLGFLSERQTTSSELEFSVSSREEQAGRSGGELWKEKGRDASKEDRREGWSFTVCFPLGRRGCRWRNRRRLLLVRVDVEHDRVRIHRGARREGEEEEKGEKGRRRR